MNELNLILESQTERKEKSVGRRLKAGELYLFSSIASRLLEGGVPLLRCLEILQKEFKRPSLKKVPGLLEERIRQGESLAGALEHSGAFPFYFVQMIRAGEVSGNLAGILARLSVHIEKEESAGRKIREALAYPSLVLILGFVTVFILLKVVIPKLAGVYEGFGQNMPWVTQAALALSGHFFLLALILAGIIILGGLFVKQNSEAVFSFLSKAPVLGPWIRARLLNQLSSLLSLLLNSGIALLEALEIAAKTFSFSHYRNRIQEIRMSLSQGEGFAQAAAGRLDLEESTAALLLSGEESGKLAEALGQISRETEQRVEAGVSFCLKLLEPMLILGVGLVVGFIVISTLLPILQMSELMQ